MGVMMNKGYKVGDIVKGVVTGITKYGIFVSLDEYYVGLIHISEVSLDYVKNPADYVQIGDSIYSEVIGVHKERRMLDLSIKNINYRDYIVSNEIIETRLGFLPLKNNLDRWIEEKYEYYENKK